MSELMQQVAGAFPATSDNPTTGGGVLDLAKIGTGGMGLLSSIMNMVQQQQALGSLKGDIKTEDQLLANPALLAAKAKAVEAPLSMGLQQDVGNATQSQLASRGLSSSPAQAEAITSQTLAPFEQQSQQTAMDAVLKMLGLPVQAASAELNGLKGGAAPGSTSALWSLFNKPGSTPPAIDAANLKTPGSPGLNVGDMNPPTVGGFDPSALGGFGNPAYGDDTGQ